MSTRAESAIAPLPEHLSARELLSTGQRRFSLAALAFGIGTVLLWAVTGYGVSALAWAQVGVIAMTACYVLVIGYRVFLVLIAPRAVEPVGTEIPDDQLPSYAVLVPLHREEAVLPSLLAHLDALRYPVGKLHVLLLVEEDDSTTRSALAEHHLGPQYEIVVVPEGGPRTKPNACNVGLARVTAEHCVIFDAEDRPEPDQLRKAAAAFAHHPPEVACLQAELAYWNPWTNWLTRMFAGEYALNFRLTLLGLDRLDLPIPLGGTSNHLRTSALRELGGWDPHNVTEDADLGIRIARRGWQVRMLDSVTLEEANSRTGNWIRQRSRWIKGHLQTWLVHMRHPRRLLAELGWRRFASFHLTFAVSNLTVLCNPVFWALSCWYLLDGPSRIEPLYPGPVLYAGVVVMLLGNLATTYLFIVACMVRPGLHRAVPAMLTIPLYWALMSVAAIRAVTQLVRPKRRHYWELTAHGLVLDADTAR
ncbi:Glycosyltransferase, catalytic subunit of cellulose synthase and poly-beta-1,6-N-acetylglucosamine synthase [Saccharopolyspora kobensis]|uniref:Glycosyltransferase, catalytic subunit of cellulose synthase and poly-beta-1,6-N-acetylglucosamine synthase n=1 Tax=Saccharopolyspora kobensis TaxID=146035 RepID=A0A1H6DGP4_9PSEU|nr:glycosyltransferase family 2 protein [Saccharopolyspora kobensis]SEG84657.1 Glycosyltransferase, catalytic subunit of cellulose synthase and poly-beta-1,6-N-acetylglucosamine synthase [Saccharopolyspora kobensis]SFD27240.1 Glycosyltransferase, catalytic subunit of cellulose synthase and poly-beta-1,6-N-acetylglucosamine synthase [Saccharopolyspora kobensis]